MIVIESPLGIRSIKWPRWISCRVIPPYAGTSLEPLLLVVSQWQCKGLDNQQETYGLALPSSRILRDYTWNNFSTWSWYGKTNLTLTLRESRLTGLALPARKVSENLNQWREKEKLKIESDLCGNTQSGSPHLLIPQQMNYDRDNVAQSIVN